MPRKRNNPVSLSGDERGKLESLISGGHASARQLTHARILLKADEGEDAPNEASWPDTKIADALEVSRSTVARVRERCVTRRDWRRRWSTAGPRPPNRAS